MSWSRDPRGPRGYHHGNLKEALIQAALDLIAQKGPAGFTFAEAARCAGMAQATSESTIMVAMDPVRMSGSVALTLNSRDASRR